MTQSEIDILREAAKYLAEQNIQLREKLGKARRVWLVALRALDRMRRRWGRERRRLGAGKN